MEIAINLNGNKRKDLATTVGELLNAEAEYQRAPSYAYTIGGTTLTRDNRLVFSTGLNPEIIRKLVNGLENKGFIAESLPDKLVIEMSIEGFDEVSLDNLRKLVAAKAELIKKALGTEDLSIEQTDEAICFPWFSFDAPSEDVAAYAQFISALCEMAKKQKRVLAIEKTVENEKYAFRCFLLRLGFIGEEYANTRRVLLRNLTGNGSLKNEKVESGAESVTSASSVTSKALPESADSAEIAAKHILRGLLQYLETII